MSKNKGKSCEQEPEVVGKERYKIRERKNGDDWYLEHGTTSKVFLAKDTRFGSLVALKRLNVLVDRRRIEDEIALHREIKHENIIKYIDSYKVANHTEIILEYAAGGALIERLEKKGKFSERDASNIIKQVSSAVKYLHNLEEPVFFVDIKLENILLASAKEFPGTVKLSDFGHSQRLEGSGAIVACEGATRGFQSPEQVTNKKSGLPSDIWCIGVTTFYMMTGKLPFIPFEAPNGYYFDFDFRSIKAYESISPEGRTFTEKLLQKRPEDRPNATEVCELAEKWHKHAPHKETLVARTKKRVASTKKRLNTLISSSSRGRGLKPVDASQGRPSEHNNH